MSVAAVIVPCRTIQRSSPWLLTAKITPTLARFWLGRTIGVWPRGA